MDAVFFQIDYNINYVTTSKKCLTFFNRNSDDLTHRFITVVLTWLHFNKTKTK